jgi:hypothetical protein
MKRARKVKPSKAKEARQFLDGVDAALRRAARVAREKGALPGAQGRVEGRQVRRIEFEKQHGARTVARAKKAGLLKSKDTVVGKKTGKPPSQRPPI